MRLADPRCSSEKTDASRDAVTPLDNLTDQLRRGSVRSTARAPRACGCRVEIRRDAFAAAQRGDAPLASQALGVGLAEPAREALDRDLS